MGTWDHCSRDDRIRSPSASEWLIVVGLYVFPSTVYICISAVHIYSTDLYRVATSNLPYASSSIRAHARELLGERPALYFSLDRKLRFICQRKCALLVPNSLLYVPSDSTYSSYLSKERHKLSPFWMTQQVPRHLTRRWHLFCDSNAI